MFGISPTPQLDAATSDQGRSTRSLYMMDLFAGCGGLSRGFEQAGFTSVFVNELNDDARATYLANRPHPIGGKPLADHPLLVSSDVNELTDGKLENILDYLSTLGLGIGRNDGDSIDVLAGGPPCQGYSGIGYRRSYSVDKIVLPANQLYNKMAEVIETVRPRIFLFENVKGLLSARWTAGGTKGEIWRDVFGRFRALGVDAGYQVRWSLVKASNYGVPQNRPRVLIVGFRDDVVKALGGAINLAASAEDAIETGMLPAFGEVAPNIEDVLGDLVDASIPGRLRKRDIAPPFGTYVYLKPPANDWQRYFRPGALSSCGHPLLEQEYSRHAPKVVDKFDAMHASGGEIPAQFKTKKFAQRLLPPRWGNAGPTITACSLADDYVHFSQPRTLTVREWARLQTFPDSYVFEGKRTTGGLRRAGNPQAGNFEREVPKYTQIGNAVPVKLAEAVAKHFAMLFERGGIA